MSSRGTKTNNVGWEVDLGNAFEGVEEPDVEAFEAGAWFTLMIGEACRPKGEHLQELDGWVTYKLIVRRDGPHDYWYLDVDGKQGRFNALDDISFSSKQWEKI